MAFGSAPRGIPRILQWLLAGLMLLIGLAVGGLGFLAALLSPVYLCRTGLPLRYRLAFPARGKPQRREQGSRFWRRGLARGGDAGQPGLDV